MISKELFLKVNNIVAENRHHPVSHKEDDENLPLKRFMRCAKCDTPMTGYLVPNKGLYYYKCRVKGCYSNKSAKQAHEQFRLLLSAFQVNLDHAELTGEYLKELFGIVLNDQFEDQRLIKAKMTEVNERIEAVQERFAIGEIDKELYSKFLGKYSNEREDLQKQLAKMALDSSNLDRCVKSLVEKCRNPLQMWEISSIDAKMRIQNEFFPDGITYDSEKGAVLTKRVSAGFLLVPELARVLAEKKMGEPISSPIL